MNCLRSTDYRVGKEMSEEYLYDIVPTSMTVPTSLISFHETEHGRLRRRQRGIDKKDLKAAVKYGTARKGLRRKNGNPTLVYTYNGIVYIVDSVTKEEVTCYTVPLTLIPKRIDPASIHEHDKYCQKVKLDSDCWTSYTVIVVDTSGSMRTADVWGARHRLASVWLAVALDFVANRLERGEVKPTDVLSIVTLCDNPSIILEEVPFTWIVYNKIVDFYNESLNVPSGHGTFLPALQLAENMFSRCKNDACAPTLLFLSDGAPSDRVVKGFCREDLIVAKVGEIASKFGRRLTFTAVGIGDKKEFATLHRMVDVAKDYGVIAQLMLPSLSSESIGVAFTETVASTITRQQELYCIGTSHQRKVKSVIRESKSKASKLILTVNDKDYWIYPKEDVVRKIYDENCGKSLLISVPLKHSRAEYVAMAKQPFGEGAERLAYRIYEVAKDGKTIVGSPMVAKESRFVMERDKDDGVGCEKERFKFVKSFCLMQQLVRQLSHKFNEKMDTIKNIHPKTPHIHVLDCWIYELDDVRLGKLSVLVEDKLDHTRWCKWNDNGGRVYNDLQAPANEKNSRLITNGVSSFCRKMNVIHEEIDEDYKDAEEYERQDEMQGRMQFSPFIVAQAFSHFTYIISDKKRLVCDLQGVFDSGKNVLMLSDPVIHNHCQWSNRSRQYGSTDRGKKGIDSFLTPIRNIAAYYVP